jgi:uncharacterized protein DUF2017
MTELRIQPVGTKHIRISGLHPLMAVFLQELPEILEFRDKPPAHERLYPTPTADDGAANREWQDSIEPELRHLFTSAGDTVARDLTGLAPQPGTPARLCVTISAAHVSAWMSAINQARLILGALFGIADEQDMFIAAFDPQNPKHTAAFRIEALGELLHKFVELEAGERSEPPPGRPKKAKARLRKARRKKTAPKKKRQP